MLMSSVREILPSVFVFKVPYEFLIESWGLRKNQDPGKLWDLLKAEPWLQIGFLFLESVLIW